MRNATQADRKGNSSSFVDLSRRMQLQTQVTDSRSDLQMLEVFLRGEDLKDQLPLTPHALEYFRTENQEFANKLKTSAKLAEKAKKLVMHQTNQLQRVTKTPGPAKTGASKAEELYQKDYQRRQKIEALRNKLERSTVEEKTSPSTSQGKHKTTYQGVEANKRALADKILKLQAQKGKSESELIVGRVFESSYVDETLLMKNGEEVVLRSALKERRRKEEPNKTDKSLIRRAKLSESKGPSSKSTNVTQSRILKSDMSRSRILNKSSLSRDDSPTSMEKENRTANTTVTKRKKTKDGQTVYVNYKGEKPPVVPTVSAAEEARKKKEEVEAEKRLALQAAEQRRRDQAEALALKAQKEAEEAELAALEGENYDLADEKRKLELIQRQRDLERQRQMVEESARKKRERNYLEEYLVSKSKLLPRIDPDDPVLARKIAQKAKIELPGKPLEFDPAEERPKYTKPGVETKGQPLSNFKKNPNAEVRYYVQPKTISTSKLSEDTNDVENGFRRFLGVPEVGKTQQQYERYRPEVNDEESPEEPEELDSEALEEKRKEDALMKPSLAPVSANPFKARDAQLSPPPKSPNVKPVANPKPKQAPAMVAIPPLEIEARISTAGEPQVRVRKVNSTIDNEQGSQASKPAQPKNDIPKGSQSQHSVHQEHPDVANQSQKASVLSFSAPEPGVFDDDEESIEWQGMNPHDIAQKSHRKPEKEVMSQADLSDLKIKDLNKQKTIGGDEPIQDSVKTPRKIPEDLQSKDSNQHGLQPKAKVSGGISGAKDVKESKPSSVQQQISPTEPDLQADQVTKKSFQSKKEPVSSDKHPPADLPVEQTAKKSVSEHQKSGQSAPPLKSAELAHMEALERYSHHKEVLQQVSPIQTGETSNQQNQPAETHTEPAVAQ